MQSNRSFLSRILVLFALLALAIGSGAVAQEAVPVKSRYTKHEYQIAMRDGVKLFTSVYVPKDASQKYPIMMQRTPYSVAPYGPDNYRGSLGPSPMFMEDGFIFVYQDVRGRNMSEGEFAWTAPSQAEKIESDRRRRDDRHLGHHRVADQEHAEQQRARGDVGHLLSGPLRRAGAD